jgi:hypothetical protein
LDLAHKCLPLARQWAAAAQRALVAYRSGRPGDRVSEPLIIAAFDTHFHMDQVVLDQATHLATIAGNFQRAADALASPTFIDETSEDRSQPDLGRVVPAYTAAGMYIRFTRWFRDWDAEARTGFGPMCRTAMLLHETMHYVSDEIDDFAAEWEEEYGRLSADEAARNASSYQAFAQHVFYGRDTRYGAEQRAL